MPCILPPLSVLNPVWNSVSLPITAPNWQKWNHIWKPALQPLSLENTPKEDGKDVKQANLKYHANPLMEESLLCFSIFSLFSWCVSSSQTKWMLIKQKEGNFRDDGNNMFCFQLLFFHVSVADNRWRSSSLAKRDSLYFPWRKKQVVVVGRGISHRCTLIVFLQVGGRINTVSNNRMWVSGKWAYLAIRCDVFLTSVKNGTLQITFFHLFFLLTSGWSHFLYMEE